MKRKHKRLAWLLAGAVSLGGATALVLLAFDDSLAYFYAPSDLQSAPPPTDRAIRLGGLVAAGSVSKDGLVTHFEITDGGASVTVAYEGILPDLFREGQGVIVEGRLQSDGSFRADTVLAKHDESYMPAEVADALKKQGHWQGETAP